MRSSRVTPITTAMGIFRELTGRGHNAVYSDLAAGEYDSIVIGARRYVVWASYLAFVERCRRGVERDPAEKRAAQAAYQESLNNKMAQHVARARRARRFLARGAPLATPAPMLLSRPKD